MLTFDTEAFIFTNAEKHPCLPTGAEAVSSAFISAQKNNLLAGIDTEEAHTGNEAVLQPGIAIKVKPTAIDIAIVPFLLYTFLAIPAPVEKSSECHFL